MVEYHWSYGRYLELVYPTFFYLFEIYLVSLFFSQYTHLGHGRSSNGLNECFILSFCPSFFDGGRVEGGHGVWWFITLIMFFLLEVSWLALFMGVDVGAGTQARVLRAQFRFPFWGTKMLWQSPSNFLWVLTGKSISSSRDFCLPFFSVFFCNKWMMSATKDFVMEW